MKGWRGTREEDRVKAAQVKAFEPNMEGRKNKGARNRKEDKKPHYEY